ncbi:MAG: ArnT family glycosyltransferase [Candidatus Aminicenantia bacterium]
MHIHADLKKKLKFISLILLILIAFLLRIWGTAGVYVRPDDHEQLGHAKIVYNQYFQHYLSYPVFYQYVGGFILKFLNIIFQFLGAVEKGYKKEFNYDEIAIIMRTLSALYGAFSVLLTYSIARKIFDERVALLSSFFLTFTFFHILIGHSALLDPQMGFFSLLAFYFICKIFEDRKISSYILAGLFTGFAIASKYNAFFIVFSLLISHICTVKEPKKFWGFFDFRIIISGIFSILGFLIGNPPVWLNFKSWLRSFRQASIILKPDPWMVEFKNLNFIDWLRYNKYTFALINIEYSLKIALFLLVILGLLVLIIRLEKKYAILLSFPIFYILIGLGVYSISRPRDHYVLIPFYIIIASKGFFFASNVIKKIVPFKTIATSITLILLIISFFPSLKSTYEILYTFRERDTLEFSEDWIYENIPPKSWNSYEPYTPFIYMPASVWKYNYIFPYRYHHNFFFILGRMLGEEPFDHLRRISRFIYISSLNSNRFKGVEKFYRKEVNFYRNIGREFKLIKKFAIKEIEAKNPEIFIYSVKRLPPNELTLILPEQISLNQKDRDFFFANPPDYGKTNLIKLLKPGKKIEIRILSKKRIKKFFVFVYGKEGESVLINKNLKMCIKEHGHNYMEIEGKETVFPGENLIYSIKVESISSTPVLVKILFDPLKVGYELFKIKEYRKSAEQFSEKIKEEPENLDAFLYLHEARIRSGLKPYISKLKSKKEKIENYFEGKEKEKWIRWVERFSSKDISYLIESKTLFLEIEDISSRFYIINDLHFLNRKAVLVDRDFELELPFFLPQNYILTLILKSPEDEIFSKIEISAEGKIFHLSRIEKLPDNFFRVEIPFEKKEFSEKLSLKVQLREPFIIFDDLRIAPDIEKFLKGKREDLKESLYLLKE